MLTAAAACAVTSFALATTVAQAAPSAGGGAGSAAPHVTPSKLPKIKGAQVYYFCGSIEGCPTEHFLFVVYGKAKTWELYGDPGYGGYTEKFKKNPYTYFIYDEGGNNGCYLVALKVKGGYINGGFFCYDEEIGEYVEYEVWEAFK